MTATENKSTWNLIFAAWVVSLISTGGSLFFSDIMLFPPCTMCWYQRIAMYPLVLLYPMALLPLNTSIIKMTAPLIGAGWLVALWHNLLHWEIVPETATPCSEGVSCSTVYLDYGFITIPLLSLIAFTIIGALLFVAHRNSK